MFTLRKLPGTCSMYELIDVEATHFNLKTFAEIIYEDLIERDDRDDVTVIYNSRVAVSLFDAIFFLSSSDFDYTLDDTKRHRLLKKMGFKKVYFNRQRLLSTYILHFKDLKRKLKV